MSALLTPKTVDSGWFRRWCRQGWALWTRAPMLFVLNLLLPPIIMAWMPPRGSVKSGIRNLLCMLPQPDRS
ncbi:hypothetical protein [Acidithiobacillus thiooxidans]|uniref:hypothetical protein n=1 Tax=Acidithiobacillus thiooxidans TaxID=930 RepID=UPI0009DA8C9B|nr:hypothetical protein [Acidithiobacillus thiooxidans]